MAFIQATVFVSWLVEFIAKLLRYKYMDESKKSPRNLSLFESPQEARKFLDSFDTVITDCDGVLWKNGPVPGVSSTLEKLKALGKNIYFLSNNSTKSFKSYSKQFREIGVNLKPDCILHPGLTIVEYLKDINFTKKIFCIGTTTLVEMIKSTGIECITAENSCPEDLKWFLDKSADDQDIGAVILDFDINLNYLKISKAVSILQRQDALFIVGSTDTVLPIANRPHFIGPGTFVNMVSELSGRLPMVMGKPSTYLRDVIKKKFKITDPQRTLIIGDMIETDIAFGHMCGFQKLLVLSGATNRQEAAAASNGIHHPDYIIESLGCMASLIDKAEISLKS